MTSGTNGKDLKDYPVGCQLRIKMGTCPKQKELPKAWKKKA